MISISPGIIKDQFKIINFAIIVLQSNNVMHIMLQCIDLFCIHTVLMSYAICIIILLCIITNKNDFQITMFVLYNTYTSAIVDMVLYSCSSCSRERRTITTIIVGFTGHGISDNVLLCIFQHVRIFFTS